MVDGKGTAGPSLLYDITSTGCNVMWVGLHATSRYVGGLQHCGLGYIMIVNKLVPLGPKCSPVPC